MSQAKYDILGLGNAIVDVIAQTPDAFLARYGLTKGAMALIDEQPAEDLYAAMGDTITVSGGSAANTVIGAASFGCSAAFVGKVKNDRLGDLFTADIHEAGVSFLIPHAEDGPATARCFVLVTPDGQRTMNTFLGACQDLGEDDVDPETVKASAITYLEGYLWDPPAAKAAFIKASAIAHGAGRKVALSLSDAFCVGRYRSEFLGLVRDGTVDILFAQRNRTDEPLRDRFRRGARPTRSGGDPGGGHARRGGLRRRGLGSRDRRPGRTHRVPGRHDRRGRPLRGRASSPVLCEGATMRPARSSARWRRRRSSSTSAPARRST